MLYTNELEIEGLIASASGTPGELDSAVIRPDMIHNIVKAYEQVYPNLTLHDPEYIPPEQLFSIIKKGNPHRGWNHVGQDHDTEASEWIIRMVDKKEKKPLNICIWGGQTDLAQALWKVKNTRKRTAYQSFISKIRVYDIADQDQIYQHLKSEHPDLFYILNKAADHHDKRDAVFRGMYLGGNEDLTSLIWLKENVLENHGALGAIYPTKTWTAPNPHGALKEGDTPSWLYFLENDLNVPESPSYGGWGGRFLHDEHTYRDATDIYQSDSSARATVWRWRPDFQNEFAARMDWCVQDIQKANHVPQASLKGFPDNGVIVKNVKAGTSITFDAGLSSDPDGDQISSHWMIYPEAGTFRGEILLTQSGHQMTLTPPLEARSKEIHLILQVKDNGEPPLTTYRRVIMEIK